MIHFLLFITVYGIADMEIVMNPRLLFCKYTARRHPYFSSHFRAVASLMINGRISSYICRIRELYKKGDVSVKTSYKIFYFVECIVIKGVTASHLSTVLDNLYKKKKKKKCVLPTKRTNIPAK